MNAKPFSQFLFLVFLCFFNNVWGQQTVNDGDKTTAINFPGNRQYNWTNSNPAIGLPASGTSAGIPSFTAENNTGIKQTATIKVTPVIPGFAYVTNADSRTVSVINTITNQVVTTIPGFSRPVGSIQTKGGSRIYVSDIGSENIKIIDPVTNTITDSISFGESPVSLALSPDSSRLYVLHFTVSEPIGKVFVINTADHSIIATITVGNVPRKIVLSPDGSKLYVTNSARPGSISVINTQTNTISNTVNVGGNPDDIAISPDGSTLYTTFDGQGVTFINTSTFVLSSFIPAANVSYITLSVDGKTLYMADETQALVKVIDVASRAVVATVPVGKLPLSLSESPDGKWVYVANTANNSVSVINRATNTCDPANDILVGNTPTSVGNLNPGYQTIIYTIDINPGISNKPVITNTVVNGINRACFGSASVSPDIQQFSVSDSKPTSYMLVTAPANFEVSLSANEGYNKNITIPPVSNKIDSVVVYVRLAATAPAGNNNQAVILSSAGAADVSVPVTGIVSKPTGSPLVVDQVPNQVKTNGQLTDSVSFTGSQAVFTWTNDNPAIGLAPSGYGKINSFIAQNKNLSNVALKATITVTPQVTGGFAYITSTTNKAVYVLNTLTNNIIDTIKVGGTPGAVTVSKDGTRVFVSNIDRDQNIGVIDATTNTLLPAINAPKIDGLYITRLRVSPDLGHLYGVSTDNIFDYDLLAKNYNILPGEGVSELEDMTMAPDGSIYFTGWQGSDRAGYTYYLYKSIFSPATTPNGNFSNTQEKLSIVKTSSDGNRIYVIANAGGNVKLYILDRYFNVLQSIPFNGQGSTAIAATSDGKKIYITSAYLNVVFVYENSRFKTIPISNGPIAVGISPDDKFAYITCSAANTPGGLTILDTKDDSIVKSFDVGSSNPGEDFIINAIGCKGEPIKFNITVNATPPSIQADSIKGVLSCADNKKVQMFEFSGQYLANDVTVKAPASFEISLSEKDGYGNTITVTPSLGVISHQYIYVRSVAGNIKGNVILSSPGVTDQAVTVDGLPFPTVNPVPDQTLVSGQITTPVNFSGTSNNFTWTNSSPSIGLPAYGIGNIPSFTAINKTQNTIKATVTVSPLTSGFAYITNYAENTVRVINTINNKIVDTIPVGIHPLSIAVSGDGSKVFVYNQRRPSVSVINAIDRSKLSDITSSGVGNISLMVASYKGDRLYTAGYNGTQSFYYVINTLNNTFTTVPLAFTQDNAKAITDMALSPDGKKLYLLINRSLSVYNTETNVLIGSYPSTDLIFEKICVGNNGKVYALATNTLKTFICLLSSDLQTITTNATDAANGRGIALTPDGSKGYIADPVNQTVTVFNANTLQVTKTLTGINYPTGISISADGRTVYAPSSSTQGNGRVTVLNTEDDTQMPDIINVGLSYTYKNFTGSGTSCSGPPTSFAINVSNPSSVKTSGTLTALTSTYGKPSAQSTSFKVMGTGLNSTLVLVTPPKGFEVSADNVNFAPTINLKAADITAFKPVYVRLASGVDAGNYTGNIVLSNILNDDVIVPVVSSQVARAPLTIQAVEVHKTFGQTLINGTGGPEAFIAQGLQNSDLINTCTIDYGDGALSTDLPKVYLKSVTVKDAKGEKFNPDNYTITYIPADLIVDASQSPVIVFNGNVKSLNSTYGTSSSAGSFIVSGTKLQSGILITPPVGFEVSTDNIDFSSTVTAGAAGSVNEITVYVRLANNANVGTYSGSIVLSSNQAVSGNVSISNSVITAAPLSITIPDVAKQYGDELKSGTGFTAFTTTGLKNSETIDSVTVSFSAGNLSTADVSTYTDAVIPSLATGGSFNVANYTIKYNKGRVVVNKAKLTITANNKTRGFGEPNPVFDAVYSGFKNGETTTSLSTLPVFVTTATISSHLGNYPISPQAATASNYEFQYVDGTLTIEQSALRISIPNAFSPNGDGENDSWIIKNIENYPNSTVDIYNRRGERLYSSIGYQVPWDGKSKDTALPYETYYYIINLKNGSKAISGYVTIIR